MVLVLGCHVNGPLGSYAPGLAQELSRRGYTISGASQHLGFIAHLDRWMREQGLAVADLTDSVLDGYLAERRGGRICELPLDEGICAVAGLSCPAGFATSGTVGGTGSGGGGAGTLSAIPRGRARTDRVDGARLCRRGPSVPGRPGGSSGAGSGGVDRGRGYGVRRGGVSAAGDRVGEDDRHRAALAAGLASPRRTAAGVAGRCDPVGGGLAADRPAPGPGAWPAGPAAGGLRPTPGVGSAGLRDHADAVPAGQAS
jgi:hypothetical protein